MGGLLGDVMGTGAYGRCAPECGFLRVSSIAPIATVGAEGMEALHV